MVEKTSNTSGVKVGEVVEGTVEHVAAYGAFVRLGTGRKAMIHISELSHAYVKKVEDILAVGQKIKAKVIKIDDKGRIDLSVKAMQALEAPVKPAHKEEDFEKKLNNFLKSSDEKIADLNSKTKDPRGSKRRLSVQGKNSY